MLFQFMIITILVFLLILSVLVLIHEAGHFFVAKKLGIKVEEFGFGLPPRAFGKKIGETIYSLNWLPIGGFVKLYGEDEAGGGKIRIKDKGLRIKEDTERAFFAKTAWQRALVIVAGVAMNAVLAVFIFYIFLSISGFKTEIPLLSDYKFFGVNQRNIKEVLISQVVKGSPSEKAGIKPFSKIVAVNGSPVLDTKEFVNFVNNHKGKEIELVWSDSKSEKSKKASIIPRMYPPKGEGALGVALFSVASAQLSYDSAVQRILSGIVHPVNLMLYNFNVIGNLIKISFQQKSAEPLSQGVSGPVGIASITGSILKIPDTKEKILGLLNLVGVLSISLAFFNVLPIPALDGGRLFFIGIEGIFRKKVSAKIEGYTHAIGMAVLLGLILLITFKDLTKLFIK